MKEQLERIRASALEALAQAKETSDLEALRVRILGKKSRRYVFFNHTNLLKINIAGKSMKN